MAKQKYARRKRRLFGTSDRPRLVVYRSLKHVYGQIIDDSTATTLVSAATINKDLEKELKDANRMDRCKKIGEALAKRAMEKDIKQVVFDRNGYKYHGRVKAIAEGAREGGLEF